MQDKATSTKNCKKNKENMDSKRIFKNSNNKQYVNFGSWLEQSVKIFYDRNVEIWILNSYSILGSYY